ncbi:hypothetical protein QBC38DRAFT_251921 [Podospora fimiseda]|uniref:Uncharacterized protein n=1 Tax=Podospora fimiseda TaxID=252190 RepID=A0AAN7GVL7_9PEZI|nr:hypothetical protein QBC38DRAFT_251921 [Podospora fimiseda]
MASPPSNPSKPSSPSPSEPFTLTPPTVVPYTPGSSFSGNLPRHLPYSHQHPPHSPPPPADQRYASPAPSTTATSPPSSFRLSTSTLPYAATQFRTQSLTTAPTSLPLTQSTLSLGASSQFQSQNIYPPQPHQSSPQQTQQLQSQSPSPPNQVQNQTPFQFSTKLAVPQFQPLSQSSSTSTAKTPPKSDKAPITAPTGATRIQLSLDYGTTFTGVAYLVLPASKKELELESLLDSIKVIQKWPTTEAAKAPSQISYSLTPKGYEQWGYNIDDNSLVLKRTKIQLEEVRDRVEELRTLGELLNRLRLLKLTREEVRKNGVPKHLAKEPEDIVKDYLDKIAEMTVKDISENIGRKVLENISIDLTVTHPAIWSDRALNSTYRAVRAAFNSDRFPQLNNISFVPEPVACAHYTLREAWQNDQVEFNRNDCFIVVDAGGGTVDLASYKVLSIDHSKKQIKLEQVGIPLGDTCGATCVDKSFEVWAKDKLGPEDWERLMSEGVHDAATGGHSIVRPNLRRLQDRFTPIKHQFDGKENTFAWPIQLPRHTSTSVGATDDASRAQSGALRVTTEDLREMFDDSVDRTLYLVEQAVDMIEIVERLRVKKIFLSGGFAQSPYLFNKVKEFGVKHRIEVQRGDDCWIAVAKGAIIKSLGIYTEKPEFVKSCPRSYGIKVRRPFASYENHLRKDVDVDGQGKEWATDQLRWFILKGDGMFPNRPIVVTHDCNFSAKASEFPSFQKRASSSTSALAPVYREIVFIASPRDKPPLHLEATDEGQEQQVSLRCDLTKVPRDKIEEAGDKKTGKTLTFHVKVEIRVLEKVFVKITSGDNLLDEKEVEL